jgi:putative sugar O-methyltransferase
MLYFPSINYHDLHPSVSKIFHKSYFLKATAHDKKIVKKFISFFKEKEFSNIHGGEWSWINKNKRINLIKSLKNFDVDFLSTQLVNLFKSKISYGIISSTYKNVFKNKKNRKYFISDVLKNISVWEEFVKLKKKDYNFIHTNEKIGNPYGIIYKKKKILYDTPRHDYYADKIISILKNKKNPTILEIGGGYGGLLIQLLKRKFNFTYINIDLPETLLISYYYLKKTFGAKICLTKDLKLNILKNKIIYIPYEDELLIKKINIDLLFNANSFSEMSKKVLYKYFNLINNKIKPEYILHQNSNVNLFPKSKRHKEIQSSDFPINMKNYTKISSTISMFQGGSGRYREFLFKKN